MSIAFYFYNYRSDVILLTHIDLVVFCLYYFVLSVRWHYEFLLQYTSPYKKLQESTGLWHCEYFFRKQYLSIATKRQRGIPMAWPAHASDHTCITYGESWTTMTVISRTQDVQTMLVYCSASVADAGSTINQRWLNVSSFQAAHCCASRRAFLTLDDPLNINLRYFVGIWCVSSRPVGD